MIDDGASPQQLLEKTSLADVLGSANPYKNQMQWLESDDEFRKQFPDAVDELHKGAVDETGTVNLMRSAGPISDAYILAQIRPICSTGLAARARRQRVARRRW
ncbi:hypothetical protein [Bradyrhizobium sp. STM 3557]|uniref:hypothetical protein n=1 Tax=Bradyrhizobium sp. STM 3557 TaxID=578920 RepID=UPI00388EBFDC